MFRKKALIFSLDR